MPDEIVPPVAAPVTAPVTPTTPAAPAVAAVAPLVDPGTAPVVTPDWPSDWREKLAGDDKGELERLKKYPSPLDVNKQNRELQKLRDSGQFIQKISDNATPEQVAAYRKQLGVPETPEAYEIKDVGFEIDDAAKARIAAVAPAFHAANLTPTQVNAVLKGYGELAVKEQQAQQERETAARDQRNTELRQELGGEYQASFNVVAGVMEEFPALREVFGTEALKDGIPVGLSTAGMRDLIRICRELRPYGAISIGGAGDKTVAAADELKRIDGLMANPDSVYWKGTEDERAKLKKTWQELYNAQEAMKARGKAA